jgi:hypothetical protein
MSALFTANRLLPRLSIVCAMAACVLSGFGANRFLVGFVSAILPCRCRAQNTYYVVVHTHLPVIGAVAAVALLVSSLVVERIAKSDNSRLHSIYLLSLLGFLLALAIWGLSALGLPGISSCMQLAQARAVVLDMDGTLVLGDSSSAGHRPLPGSVEHQHRTKMAHA